MRFVRLQVKNELYQLTHYSDSFFYYNGGIQDGGASLYFKGFSLRSKHISSIGDIIPESIIEVGSLFAPSAESEQHVGKVEVPCTILQPFESTLHWE